MHIAIVHPQNVFRRLDDRSRVYFINDVAVVLNSGIRVSCTIDHGIDPERITSILEQVPVGKVTPLAWVTPEQFVVIHPEKYNDRRIIVRVGEPDMDLEHKLMEAHWCINETTALCFSIAGNNPLFNQGMEIAKIKSLEMVDFTELPVVLKVLLGSLLSGNDYLLKDQTMISFVASEINNRAYVRTN